VAKDSGDFDLSVVIPAWNEGTRILETFDKLNAYTHARGLTCEILVVDDGSTDNTREVVESAREKNPHIHLLTYEGNHGKGYAVKHGMLRARGNRVLFADADGSTPFEAFDTFQKFFELGYQVVIGSRYIKGSFIQVRQPFLRRVLSRAANKLIQVLILWGIKDTQCGFKAFTREAAQDIFSQVSIERWGFDMEVLVIARKHQYKIAEAPVRWLNSFDSRIKFVNDARQTLHDLFYIKKNLMNGVYDKK
jgi:dolichyl-phosphate beta-glucosyltransferase